VVFGNNASHFHYSCDARIKILHKFQTENAQKYFYGNSCENTIEKERRKGTFAQMSQLIL
jgi:hypothetical protein